MVIRIFIRDKPTLSKKGLLIMLYLRCAQKAKGKYDLEYLKNVVLDINV